MKYVDINLTKYVQDLYAENYNILLIEIKIDLNKWGEKSCSWTGYLNIVKISILL